LARGGVEPLLVELAGVVDRRLRRDPDDQRPLVVTSDGVAIAKTTTRSSAD